MRQTIYAIIVIGFLVGGCFDLADKEYKLATVAFMFAIANGVIFFWK